MPTWITRYLAWMSTGAVLGGSLCLAFAETFSVWWQTPGSASSMCNCAEITASTAKQVSLMGFGGAGIGAVVGLSIVGTTSWHQWRSQRRITAVQQAMGIQNGGGGPSA